MSAPVVCTGQVTFVNESTVSCAGEWVLYESDLLEFANLLTFNSELFGLCLGACAIAFVVGHYSGHVARNLTRV